MYCQFEKRNEIEINGEKLISQKGFEKIGKILIPNHYVLTRDEILNKLKKTENLYNYEMFNVILTKNPLAKKLVYLGVNDYQPLDLKKMLILSEEQLK